MALVGLPGSGKSSVGWHLAKRLSSNFLDSDQIITDEIACSIREYFEREGEEKFRLLEERVIAQLCLQQGVLSTGGGVVTREVNRINLKKNCYVVYLRSTPEEIYRRLKHDKGRPLLQVADPLAKLRELSQQRDPLYQACAHFVVDTSKQSMSRVINMIVMQLELAGLKSSVDLHSSSSTIEPIPES